MPACLAIIAERAFACPLHSTWSASLRCERHDLVWCEWRRNRWQHFFLAQRSYQALWLTPPSYRRPLHVMPDSEWMRSSHVSWQRLSMSSGCTRVLAYFHIQVAPHHIWFLRFAFAGVAYQYKVLPFGLSLAPHTFIQCLDAALSPLRQMGIRILNYLDDWLILSFWFSYRLNADDSNCLSGVNYDFPSTLLAWNLGLTTPRSSWNQGWVMYPGHIAFRASPPWWTARNQGLKVCIERSASYRKSEHIFDGRLR